MRKRELAPQSADFPQFIPVENHRTDQLGNLPNSLETGETAAFSPILVSASKYNFPARVIAGKMIKLSLIFVTVAPNTL